MSPEPNEFQTTTKYLLDEQNKQRTASFRIRKQQKQEEPQLQKVKPSQEKAHKQVIGKLHSNSHLQTHKFNPEKTDLILQNENQEVDSINLNNFSQKILLYQCLNQIKKIQTKQSKLTSQSRRILCKVGSVIVLIALFFIVLLKVFLFFSNQFIGTLIESFREQLFDPAITNDQLQLEIFYIQEVCFIITALMLFFFVIFCTILAKKFYMGNLQVYRKNNRVLAGLKIRKEEVEQQIDTLNSANILT